MIDTPDLIETFSIPVASIAMYARLSRDGTAMSEAALCAEHFTSRMRGLFDSVADSAGDAGGPAWENCSGNDVLRCCACGVDCDGSFDDGDDSMAA